MGTAGLLPPSPTGGTAAPNLMTALFGLGHHPSALKTGMAVRLSDSHTPWPTSSMSSSPPVFPYPFLTGLAGFSSYMLPRKQPTGSTRQSGLLRVLPMKQNILCASPAVCSASTSAQPSTYLCAHPFLISLWDALRIQERPSANVLVLAQLCSLRNGYKGRVRSVSIS